MGEISLQDAMQQFLKNSKFKTYIQAIQIEELWETMMGKTVAKYTDKIQIIGTTLFITSYYLAIFYGADTRRTIHYQERLDCRSCHGHRCAFASTPT